MLAQGRQHHRSGSGTLLYDIGMLSNGTGSGAAASGGGGVSNGGHSTGGGTGGGGGNINSGVRVSTNLDPPSTARRSSTTNFNGISGGVHGGPTAGKAGGSGGSGSGGSEAQVKLEVMRAAIMNSFGRSPGS